MKVIRCNSENCEELIRFVQKEKARLGRMVSFTINQKGMLVIGECCAIRIPYCKCGTYFGGKKNLGVAANTGTSLLMLDLLGILKDNDEGDSLREKVFTSKEITYVISENKVLRNDKD